MFVSLIKWKFQLFCRKKKFNSEIEDLAVCRADLTEFEFKMLKVRLKISFLQNRQIFAYFSNKQVEKNKSFLSCCHLILDLTVINYYKFQVKQN